MSKVSHHFVEGHLFEKQTVKVWSLFWTKYDFLCFPKFSQKLKLFFENFQKKKFERKIAGEVIKHILNKFENAGGTCAGAVGCLAHAGGKFATAPTAPLSKPYLKRFLVFSEYCCSRNHLLNGWNCKTAKQFQFLPFSGFWSWHSQQYRSHHVKAYRSISKVC